MLIGLTGHAQNGKDTAGQYLVDHYGFQRFAFADQLKALALECDPSVTTWPGPKLTLSMLVAEKGWELAKTLPEVRRFLIALGIGARNIIGPDVWVEAVQTAIDGEGTPNNIVVTDVRFPNEVDWLRRNGGYLVRVRRRDFKPVVDPNDESERYVDTFFAHDIIAPTGVEYVQMGMDNVLADLRRKEADERLMRGYH